MARLIFSILLITALHLPAAGTLMDEDVEGPCLVQTSANLMSQQLPRADPTSRAEVAQLLLVNDSIDQEPDASNTTAATAASAGTSTEATTAAPTNGTASGTVEQKNKVALLIIELIPPLGCLGVDRLYLGSIVTGCIKLAVCVCTCFIGGAIWGIIDGVVILLNALNKEESIEALGMSASFAESEVETAQTLGWVMLALWLLLGIFAVLFHRTRYPNWVTERAERSSTATGMRP
mmetsp:Transcript_66686/g.124554  ORF Transcript_66686/g.124554 Transcript_66686/m.124554 type:complete len:235 (-) Transcript_66686:95-799(-)